jgi:hypothetical protein
MKALEDANFGIVCLTRENKAAPWVLFEAGALARQTSVAIACPLLIDLDPADVGFPLQGLNVAYAIAMAARSARCASSAATMHSR